MSWEISYFIVLLSSCVWLKCSGAGTSSRVSNRSSRGRSGSGTDVEVNVVEVVILVAIL